MPDILKDVRRILFYMACIMSAASLTAADLKEAPMPDILKDVRRILFYGDSLTHLLHHASAVY